MTASSTTSLTECVYLRKPLPSAGKATHLAFQSLQRCMRKGHWGCASDTVLLRNTYLGPTWFWYSLLIEPLTKYVSKMRAMQTTFLSLMLGLYIPATVSSHAALLLHRLRRRLVLVLLNHMPSRQWTVIWAKRRWGYLGHTLRRETGTVSRQDMLAPTPVAAGPFSPPRAVGRATPGMRHRESYPSSYRPGLLGLHFQ